MHSAFLKPRFVNLLILCIAVVLGMTLYFYANNSGLGLTHDSYYYLRNARIFGETGYLDPNQFAKVVPYQSLQIIIMSFFSDPFKAMYYFNATCFLITIVLYFFLVKKLFTSFPRVILSMFLLITSTPILMVHSFLWTEPLFITILTLQWFVLLIYLEKKDWWYLLLLVGLSVLSCWQRKSGMLFSLGLLIAAIFYFLKSTKLRLMAFFSLSLVIILLYGGFGTYNFIGEFPNLKGTFTNISNSLNVLSAWILPLPIFLLIRLTAFLLVVIFIIFNLSSTLRKLQEFKKIYFISIAIVFISYFLMRLIYWRPDFDEAERYLAPLVPLFCILLSFTVHNWINTAKTGAIRKYLIAALVAWACYPTIRILKNAEMWHNRPENPLTLKKDIQFLNYYDRRTEKLIY